jgi:hypothetical protein
VGICRHRALLFKYLADLLGLRSRVARGEYWYGRGADDVAGHAWNVVIVGKARQSDKISHIDIQDDRIDTVISHIISRYPVSISRMTISIW